MHRSRLTACSGLFLLIILLFGAFHHVWGLNSDPKVIAINRNFQTMVDKASQKREFLIPEEPLDFATNLTWDVNIAKKALSSEKIPASFTIEETGTGKQVERKLLTATGNLAIPKGKQYKVIVDAGEYASLLMKIGATVKANLSFTEARIKYALSDKPFAVDFEIAGPAGLDQWKWQWSNDSSTPGQAVSHQFATDGKTIITVVGSGKTAAGTTSRNYSFEFDVPPLVILNSKIDPQKGPAELSVNASANAVVNYGQKAMYNWSFGNGVELSGPEAHNNYLKPGRYQVTLTAVVEEYKIEKTWLVDVSPETILPNLTVTPALGPIPLKVTGTANPKISGGPAQLEYSWETGGQVTQGSSFAHTFTEPGYYQLIVKTTDKLHPDLVIPEEVILIQALPPQINLKTTASITKGTIPLAVNFDSGATITGSPVEVVYRWEFGDGEVSNLEKPTHTYKQPGEYQVHLIVNDRLHSGNLVDITLPLSALPPQFKVTVKSSDTEGLAPFKINFYAETSVIGSPCEPQYRWDFDDGTISFEQNPAHIFKQPGDYNVTLEVKDRFHPTVIDKVTTHITVGVPKLRLTAQAFPNSGPAPLTVKCQASATEEDLPKSNLKFSWDFGDGKINEGPEQTHTYEKTGTYNIQVSVSDVELGITERKNLKVTVK